MLYKILEKLEKDNLLDWGIILQAWKKGLPGYQYKLKADYIQKFALQEMEKMSEDIPDILVELFDAGTLENLKVTDLLEDICEKEKINEEISLKKWRLAALEETLSDLSGYCVDDLIYLDDFWMAWGNPQDKPHIIQGIDNQMNPTQHYSENNYEKLLQAHKKWIEQEKKKILNGDY